MLSHVVSRHKRSPVCKETRTISYSECLSELILSPQIFLKEKKGGLWGGYNLMSMKISTQKMIELYMVLTDSIELLLFVWLTAGSAHTYVNNCRSVLFIFCPAGCRRFIFCMGEQQSSSNPPTPPINRVAMVTPCSEAASVH